MGVFDGLVNAAERLISKYGAEVAWQKPAPTTGDEWNPTPGTPPKPFLPRIAFFPPDSGTAASLSALFGREAPVSSEWGLMAGNCGFEPLPNDTVKRAGVHMPIVGIKTYNPNNTQPVLHIVYFA